MKTKLFEIFLILVLLLLAGCHALSYKSSANIGFQKMTLGPNAVGETCWAETGSMAYELVDAADRVFNIFCGNWEWPSARVFEVATESANLEEWLGDRAWRHCLDTRMRCMNNERKTILDGIDAILVNCKLNNGGWPYLALITSTGGKTYLADGIPSAIVSIEKVIAANANMPDKTEVAATSQATEYIKQLLKDTLYRSEDLQGYYWAMIMGQYYNGIKEFSKAEKEYWDALTIHQQVLGIDNSETSDVLMHIALELSNQEQFEQAETLFRKVENKIDIANNQGDFARYKSYAALHAANQGLYTLARELAQEATAIRSTLIGTKGLSWNMVTGPLAEVSSKDGRLVLEEELPQSVELAHSLYIEAAMRERLGELIDSDLTLDKAQFIVSSAGDAPPLWEPQLESLEGVVKDSKNELEQAERAHFAALTMFETRAPQERPTVLSYIDLGNAYYKEGRLVETLGNFRQAFNLIRKRGQSLRIEQITSYFNALLDMAEQQPSDQDSLFREMFDAAQLVRSGLTSLDIAKTVARFAEREDEIGRLIGELQQQERVRIKKRQEYQDQLGNILDPDYLQHLDRLNWEMDTIDKRMEEINQQVQATSPRYRQLINSPIAVDEVLSLLRPEEALLQVLVGKNQSYVFLLHANRVKAYSVAVTEAELVKMVNKIRNGIIREEGEIIPVTGHRLYTQLLGPIAPHIKRVSHLITVPSGPLLSLPFGLMVTEQPTASGTQFINVAWLARQTAISLVPSAQSFTYLRNLTRESEAPKSLLAFGGFVADIKEQRKPSAESLNVCNADNQDFIYLFKEADLPGTEREILKVAKLFPPNATDTFLGFDFNEPVVKAQNLDDYRILYFATHALLPDELECKAEPSLVTSLRSAGYGAEDGLITSEEILDFDLNADLVVLSACNTGGAGKTGGESLSGLARAFFFAGSRSLLVSHWYVDDLATEHLMVRFFMELRSRDSVNFAYALQQAQTEMMDKPQQSSWSHPLYWAAFTLVGDGAHTVTGL